MERIVKAPADERDRSGSGLPSGQGGSPLEGVWGGIGLAVLYVGMGLLSIRLATMGDLVAMVWLPAGIGLAGLMLGGVRMLPWVWVGAWGVNFLTTGDFGVSALLGVGNSLGPWVGWTLLKRVPKPQKMMQVVFFGALAGPLVSAVWGVGVLLGFGEVALNDGLKAFLIWWLGDGCGVLVAAPMLFNARRARGDLRGKGAEVGALVAVGVVLAVVVWGVVDVGLVSANGALMCVFLPLLVWASLRLGLWMSSMVVGVVVVGALVSVAVQLPRIDLKYVMLEMWLYTSVLGVTSLMLGALQAKKRKAEDALRGSEAQLNEAELSRLRAQRLLEAIHQVQSRFISESDVDDTFQELLGVLVEITGSAYGFIGEVNQDVDGQWQLKPLAMSNEGEVGEVGEVGEQLVALSQGALKGDGVVIWEGAGGALKTFLGMSLHLDEQLVGVVGVANGKEPYREPMLGELRPLLGACASVIVAYRNDLHRREAQEQRLQMQRKLQEAQRLESLGVLAGGIAHDFNNLLTGIMGNASMIVGAEQGDVEPLVGELMSASRRAADLCRQMLAYSGRGRFVVKPLGLSELVKEMMQLIHSSISRKAELHLDLAQGLSRVIADTAQLQQIVMNLVINASESLGGQPGEIWLETGEVMVSARELARDAPNDDLTPGKYVYFEVRDTGCGMDAQTVARIFDPFFTTKFHGRGLGLAAVQGIVRGHRGVLRVKSAPGKGSTFRLLLPVLNGFLGEAEGEGEVRHASKASGRGDVVVADDDQTIRVFLRGTLEKIGYRVHEAENGAQAVEVCEQLGGLVRFVLLDLTMPKKDGREALEEIKQRYPRLAVVLMSGFSAEDSQAGLEKTAPEAFLSKPFGVSDLLGCLERLRVLG